MRATFNPMKSSSSANTVRARFTDILTKYIGLVTTLIIGFILSISVFFLAQSWEESETQRLFDSSAQNRLATLQTDIIRHQEMVKSIADLFSSSQNNVSRKEFHAFVQRALSRQVSIHGLGWNPLVKHSEREQYTKKAHQEGFSDFQITDLDSNGKKVKAANHDDYVVVYYLAPHAGNEEAMGFNIASHPGRLEAIQQARDSGKAAITERIKLVQEQGDSFAYLIFVAVYQSGLVPNTIAERRKEFAGLAAGVFRFNDWLPFAMKDMPPVGMDVLILDQSAPIDKQFLHFHSSRTRDEVFQPTPQDLKKAENSLHWQTTVNMMGRDWSFLFIPAPAFFEKHRAWFPWSVLVAGLSFMVLLTLFQFTRTRHTARMTSTHVELLREITERKTMHAALREGEIRYRALVDSSPDWIWEIDSNKVYTYASPKMHELLGYQPEEVLGKTPFELMPPADAARLSAIFAEISANKRSFHNLENTNRHKNGQLVILEASGVPILSESGELLGYRGVNRDITQRLMNESELRAQRDFTDTVLDAAGNIIVVLDLEGRFVRFNRVAEELTNYSIEEVLGKYVWDLVIPEEQQNDVRKVFNHLRNGKADIVSQYENEWLTRDGGRRLLHWHNSVLQDDDGNISHIVAMGYDITEKKRAEAEHERLQRELQQAHKMDSLGQLTGGIAHDFNNLLGIISGYSTLLLDTYHDKGDEKLAKYVGRIIDAGDRAAKLVAQMLAFSRSDQADDMPIQFEPLLRDDLKMLRSTLPSTIEIITEIEPDLPNVLINPIHLHQILMNLSINARDAMQGVGQLNIKLGWAHNLDTESQISHKPVKGDWVELSVSDTGSGIESETAKSIFNPFFTTKGVGKGTGMGLSVIYGIMERHRGHILLESEPGKGSTFRMLFPPIVKKQHKLEQDNQGTVELPKGEGSEILIVDDELSLGIFMAELVKASGYKALSITDSTEALALFQNEPNRFSMLISDQTMPVMTGIELIKKLREIRPDLPAILCTGYSDKVDAIMATKMNIVYFEKPVDSKKMLFKIAELLNADA